MEDVNISKYRASVVRDGSKPASPGYVVSEGQNPTDPAGSGQNHLPVTITPTATGLSITENQVLGGAGTVGQYIRGDGSLADFPQASGGGSSVSYYLNGSVNQGTIGGVDYRELSKVPILGAGTQFSINANGYIAQFLTDAGDPNLLEIPGGNWNFETYFSASSSGGTPTFYVELYKYDGTTFTLIASSSTSPEFIAFGTNLTPYYSTLAVPTTTLALTDRLAVRYYVNHSGRTITLHTENNTLCQIVTTFTTGLTSLNGLTAQVQNLAVGTSGTDFNIVSATATHTFNLPTASATNRGALSSADWTTFNNKQNAGNYVTTDTSQLISGLKTFNVNTLMMQSSGNANAVYLSNSSGSSTYQSGFNFFGFNTDNHIYFAKSSNTGANTGILAWTNTATRTYTLKDASGTLAFTSDIPSLSGYVQGSGTTNYLPKFTGSTTIGNSQIFDNGTSVGIGTVSPQTVSSGFTLTVGDGATQQQPYLALSRNSLGGFWAGIRWYDGNTIKSVIQEDSDFNLRFSTSNAERLRITSGGNLLVGTTSDNGARLQVSGTATFSSSVTAGDLISTSYGTARIQIISTANNTNAALRFTAKDSGGTSKNSGLYYVAGTNTSNTFLSLSADDNNYQFNVLANGNLLVGTTTDNGARLQVSGGITALNSLVVTSSSNAALIASTNSTTGFSYLDFINSGASGRNYQIGVAGNGASSGYANNLYFDLVGVANIMTLTSGRNVLIGTQTDNGARLQVSGYGTFAVLGNNTRAISVIGGTTAKAYLGHGFGSLFIQNNNYFNGSSYVFDDTSVGSSTITMGESIAFQTGAANTNPSTKVTITNGGNVGIGVTPSAWSVLSPALEMGTGGSFISAQGATSALYTGTNAFFNGSNWIYKTNGEATYSIQNAGQHQWFTAPSGTAGNAISFTQRMTLTSSGNVGIGTSTPTPFLNANARTLAIDSSGTNPAELAITGQNANVYLGNGGLAAYLYSTGSYPLIFGTNGSERMRITSGGNVLIGTTTDIGEKLHVNGSGVFTSVVKAEFLSGENNNSSSPIIQGWNKATSGDNKFIEFYTEGGGGTLRGSIDFNRGAGLTRYNTTSDYRLKTELEDFNANAIIKNLKPKKYRMLNASEKMIGFIAHELQEFYPQAVSGKKDQVNEYGLPIYQGIDYSQLTGLLVKAIQELKQEIDTLKN